MSEGRCQDSATNSAPSAPMVSVLSSRATWQLLIAVFVLPRLGELIEYLVRNVSFVRFFESYHWDFDQVGETIVCCLQVALVCNALGPSTTRVALRWALLVAALLFLVFQGRTGDGAISLWLSAATIILFWMIWDAGPFALRVQIATLLGFWLVAAWYSDIGRAATTTTNVCMFIHCATVAAVLFFVRGSGWRLRLPDQETAITPDKFSFAQLLVWVTCCGFGLSLLRFVDFGAKHTFAGSFPDDLRFAMHMLTFVVVTPLLNLLAVYFALQHKWLRHWLMSLAIVAGAAIVLLWCDSFANPNPYCVSYLWMGKIGARPLPWPVKLAQWLITYLPFALIPTAVLLTYRAAGFCWVKKRKLKAAAVVTENGAAPER